MKKKRVLIMGAAGRDFHNFNMVYKDNPTYDVLAFTATQIPGIANRTYPAKLAGRLYPKGIPIFHEEKLKELIKQYQIDDVIFSYSDVKHVDVMHKASLVLSCGSNFKLLGGKDTKIKSKKRVISVCAVRTGCGKSAMTRYVAKVLKELGKKIVIIRHPMPYGDLVKQEVQRFAKLSDFKRYNCTIEEMEEYEQHINEGNIVYAGVDYKKILNNAEKECDVIIFDGGNNDFSFFEEDLSIVITDPLRPGHELLYHPGEVNLRSADVIIINKVDSAQKKNIDVINKNAKLTNSKALVFESASVIRLDPKTNLKGQKVLVVEDGPTLTHGDMKYGAGFIIAKKNNANIINPNLYAKGSIKKVLNKYKLEKIVPAMGYTKKELEDLKRTINSSPCDFVIDASPANLARILKINKPVLNVKYDLKIKGNIKAVIKKAVL